MCYEILLSSYFTVYPSAVIDLFHITWKYNIIIHFHHFGRQAIIILCSLWLICPLSVRWLGAIIAILRKVKYTFYQFPIDPGRQLRWVNFVLRQSTDGVPWKPGKEIGFAQNISFLKRNPICLVIQTLCLLFTQK